MRVPRSAAAWKFLILLSEQMSRPALAVADRGYVLRWRRSALSR